MYRLEMGTRFYHKRVTNMHGEPQLCVVTQVALDMIYWKRDGLQRTKERGSFLLAEAAAHVLRIP